VAHAGSGNDGRGSGAIPPVAVATTAPVVYTRRMPLRIGQIPYLNSVLFYHGLEDDAGVVLEPLVPRALSGAAVEHGIDAGPVPLVTCWDIEAAYEPLNDFCISTKDKARSIFLFSKRPFEELADASIGVTSETSTSVRLMRVLLSHVYRVDPPVFKHLDWPSNDAFLLIGDEALIHRRGVRGYPHVADLGEVWNDWTGLPFVFARWVVRSDIDPDTREMLAGKISGSLEAGWRHFDAAVADKVKELSMNIAEIREYMDGFRFQTTPAEIESIDRFRQLDAAIREEDSTPAS